MHYDVKVSIHHYITVLIAIL